MTEREKLIDLAKIKTWIGNVKAYENLEWGGAGMRTLDDIERECSNAESKIKALQDEVERLTQEKENK